MQLPIANHTKEEKKQFKISMFVQTRCKEYHTLRVRGKIGVVYDTSPESHIEIISSHRALKMT